MIAPFAAIIVALGAPWPGNVRQLADVVEQTVALATSPVVPAALVSTALKSEPSGLTPLDEAKRALERDYLIRILRITAGNVTQRRGSPSATAPSSTSCSTATSFRPRCSRARKPSVAPPGEARALCRPMQTLPVGQTS